MSSDTFAQVFLVDDAVVLQACLELRKEVFVAEQNVPIEEELDEYDFLGTSCWHFAAFAPSSSTVIGTARYIVVDGKCKAQRVAVAKEARSIGVGRLLMEAVQAHAKKRGLSEVILGAQMAAIPFYERLSYEAYGPVFDDAGIDHRMMRNVL